MYRRYYLNIQKIDVKMYIRNLELNKYFYVLGVGKSSIITRYIKGDFKNECEATIGASFMYAKVTLRDYQITLKVFFLYLIT